MTNFIQEYLVGLGFEPDESSFRKFVDLVKQADREVSSHFGGMARSILEAQGAILGAFGAVSAAIIGVVDKAAMADQSYRLLGLRMLMTTESARKMDIITKALGASIGEITWDRELHARAVLLSHDMDQMTAGLGANFERNMLGVRNLRMEFTRLEIGAKFLGMAFASDLFEKLTRGDTFHKVHDWVTGLERSIPRIADELSSYAIPVLKDTWEIFTGLGEVVKDAAVAFTNIVGLFSGDRSIESAAFSWKNLAEAIQHVEHGLVAVMKAVAGAEMAVAHASSAASAFVAGNTKVAGAEGKAAKDSLDLGSGAVLGIGALGAFGGVRGALGLMRRLFGFGGGAAEAAEGASAGAGFLGTIGALLSRLTAVGTVLGGAWAGTKLGEKGFEEFQGSRWFPEWEAWKKEHVPEWLQHGAKRLDEILYGGSGKSAQTAQTQSGEGAPSGSADVVAAIEEAARRNNVPAALALAIAKQESNLGKNAVVSPKGAIGVMQLEPGTAKDLGVDPYSQSQNIEGGVRYLGQLLTKYHGDMAKAAAAYNAGPGAVDRSAGLADLPAETRAYVPRVLQYAEGFEKSLNAGAATDATAGTGSTPFWYAKSPVWFQDSPEWYRTAPAWMTASAGRSDQAVGAVPAGLRMTAGPASREKFAAAQSLVSPRSQPVSANSTVNISVGGVYVTNPGADANTIARQVADKIREQMASRNLLDLPQVAPAW